MSMETAFLKDICANPDDDAPRLVFADWLEENGQPERAEFIRVQCELARKRIAGGAARRQELTKRAEQLFLSNREGWAKAYGPWCPEYPDSWQRGFPATARTGESLSDLACGLPDMVERAPIQSVFLDVNKTAKGDGAALAACPALGRLRGLTLWGDISRADSASERRRVREELRKLLRSPRLAQLEELSCVQLDLDTAALLPLLKAGRLKKLELYANGLDDETTRAICQSPCAATLTDLHLAEKCTWKTAKYITDTPALANLTKLDIEQGDIGDAGVRRLAGAAHLAGLRELRLYSCGIGNKGARSLADSPYLTNLRELYLARNRIIYDGAEALAASKTLPRGMSLDLWDNEMEDYTAEIRRALSKRFRKVNYGRSR
jgi:uncharacterized protein (TIGR02996 family)